MGLAEYRRKRRFTRTAEPKGKKRKSTADSHFVIQQHAARRLHFDFRLEMDGVLKSWAVPKGISLDPAEKRLAVHVEDHPIEYASFEGVIPAGEYGAGAVIVWDRGEWQPIGDATKGYRDGNLKFRLAGEKLHGSWALVRMRRKPEDRGENWLLIKERDDAAVPGSGDRLVREKPESVLSGRTLAEVAAGAKPSGKSRKNPRKPSLRESVQQTPGATRAELPTAIEPALGRLVTQPPTGDDWLHEIKFDGYRLLARLEYGKATLRTRNGLDWTNRFPGIAAAIERLPANVALLDGEVTALAADGASSFSALQQALSRKVTSGLVYHVFDLLHLDGFDLRNAELETRKTLLARLLAESQNSRLQFVDHIIGDGSQFLAQCRRLGLEGVMSKRRRSPYRSGRSDVWLKSKCVLAEPLVIGGYTTARGSKKLRALIVGYHDARGRLIYAGRVGSGFNERLAAELERQLQGIERTDSPFAVVVPKESGRVFHWVRPQLVAQVRYAGWSPDKILRHPTFEALRDDTNPTDVVREAPAELTANQNVAADKPASRGRFQSKTMNVPQQILDDLAEVRLTTPQKIMYPLVRLTKLDLVRYYVQIADWILPHVVNRPLSLVRCPEGLPHQTFFQKHAGPETPPQVERVKIRNGETIEENLFIKDLRGLISLMQIGTLEIHVWGARVDKPERPDRMVIDLDPDEAVPFSRVIEAALRVRERLIATGLTSFVKTTGGKGLHVVVPLERRQSWDDLKQFSQRLAKGMAADYPQTYTATMSKRARAGRIYLDYGRNSRGATAVAPYSTRAKPSAPVAVPLVWDELTPELRPDQFTVQNLAHRLTNLTADPWAEMADVRQALTAAKLKQV